MGKFRDFTGGPKTRGDNQPNSKDADDVILVIVSSSCMFVVLV